MNIVNRVTLQHMKQNRRRTLVTILGVIIAVAMITAVTTITGSFMDLFRRHTIRESGLWHVLFEQVPAERMDLLLQDENVEQAGIYQAVSYTHLDVYKRQVLQRGAAAPEAVAPFEDHVPLWQRHASFLELDRAERP